AIKTYPRGFRRRDFGMPRERADREHRREQHGRGQHHEHRVRDPEQITQRDVLNRDVAVQVLIDVIREIDDDQQKWKAERRDDEDLPELGEHVPVECARDVAFHARASAAARRRWRQSRMFSSSSANVPPRPVTPSRPMRTMSRMPTMRKMILSAHIAQNGEMIPLLESDSPP